MSRRRPDAYDTLGALVLLTATALGWVAVATRPAIVDQLLLARTTTVVIATSTTGASR